MVTVRDNNRVRSVLSTSQCDFAWHREIILGHVRVRGEDAAMTATRNPFQHRNEQIKAPIQSAYGDVHVRETG
jgi:hypothetical protein